MSATTTSPGPTRQISLIEAGLWALALHALLYVLLPLIGLTGLLFADVAESQDETEVRFTFSDEAETDSVAEDSSTAVDEQGTEPGTPEVAPPQPQSEPQPQPEAPATLDEPLPAIPPTMASPPVLPLPGDTVSDNPAGPVDEATLEDSPDPPSDGVEEGAEEGAEDALDETTEPLADDEPPSDVQPLEREIEQDPLSDDAGEVVEEFEQADDGRFGTLQQPQPSTPPPPLGRPAGPSIDERISAFSRAVQRFREQSPASPGQEPRNVFQPDWSNLPATGQTVGNLMFESADFDWEDYGRQIYWVIWRAWHNRLLARIDDFEKWAQLSGTAILDHANGIRFTIESNGQVTGIVVEMGSGSEPFDLSAVEGLDESLLPPLPEGFPRDSETVRVQFIGYGPVGSMRRGLEAYKRRGWF